MFIVLRLVFLESLLPFSLNVYERLDSNINHVNHADINHGRGAQNARDKLTSEMLTINL